MGVGTVGATTPAASLGADVDSGASAMMSGALVALGGAVGSGSGVGALVGWGGACCATFSPI